MDRRAATLTLVVILAFTPWQLAAQPLFAEAQPLDVRLDLPLTSLRRMPEEEGTELPARISLGDQQFELKVSPRGKSRRSRCRFPPLRLNFKTKSMHNTVFAGQDKLKMVTHCSKAGEKRGELMSEALIYRWLQRITPASFSTRRLKVTYVNTENGSTTQHDAFLIEDRKLLAERLNMAVRNERPGKQMLAPDHSALIALFQYMIGNTDFSMITGPAGSNCCHNMKLFARADQVLAIPYDFDATGVVDPNYVAPSSELSISRLTQRLYRGYCMHNGQLPTAVQRLHDHRDGLFADLAAADLPERKRKRIGKYLESFYRIIADDRQRQRSIEGRCRT